jgi:hypothetical protein
MSEIADFIRLAFEIGGRWKDRRRALEASSWEALTATASSLQELIPQHEAAIRAVVSPLIFDRDLSATCKRYRELAEGASVFSSAYEEAQGMFGVARRFKQFEEGTGKNRLALASHRLAAFQSAAFCLQWTSHGMANLLYEANDLTQQMDGTPQDQAATETLAARRQRVLDSFAAHAFPAVSRELEDPTPANQRAVALETPEQVRHLTQSWCIAWLDRMTAVLYQGGPCEHCRDTKHEPSRHGLFRILGELRATRFEQ